MLEENKERPTVSVIIPTYNRAHSIVSAIQSVLNQTYQGFEIIVVDDGSTDNTKEIMREIQTQDKRIRYIGYEKNKGAPTARNTGIKASRCDYIAFQDSDDEWSPEKLEKQMKAFESASPKVGVVYTGFYRLGKRKTYMPSIRRKKTQREGDIFSSLLEGNLVGTPTILIKRECFERAGLFDENLTALQDWELVIRISKYYDFIFVDEPLLISPDTPDSISANRKARARALELILEKHFEDFKKDKKSLSKHKKSLSKHYYRIGISLCSDEDPITNRKYLLKAIKISPFNIKILFFVLLTFLGQDNFKKSIIFYLKIRERGFLVFNRK